MITLYLRHRATTSDPWTEVPSLAASFPTLASGALPVAAMRIETGPETETPCGCPGSCPGSADESYLILRAECHPIPLASADATLDFLYAYKAAALHEAKTVHFSSSGDFVTSEISRIEARLENGLLRVRFRLAALLSDVTA